MGSGNHTLEFKLISGSPNEPIGIQKFKKYSYDNIILMTPTVKSFGSDLKVKDLLDFVDYHHNLMVFANSQSRKVIRDLANEFGIDLEDYGFIMKGGRSANPAFKTDKSTWSAELSKPLERVFSKLDSPVLFSDGVGMVV